MSYTLANSVEVKITSRNQQSFLEFTFNGHLSDASAEQAIEVWKKELATIPPDLKLDLIYNCLQMTGFDSAARKRWQSAMSELKPRTGQIWIISTNLLILSAAKTMSILTRYSIKSVRTLAEVGK